MKGLIRIYITPEDYRSGESQRTGKQYSISPHYVFLGKPFPEEVNVYYKVDLPKGHYDVPYQIEVYNGNYSVKLDFKQAVKVEK